MQDDMIVPDAPGAEQTNAEQVVIAPQPGETEGTLLENAEPPETESESGDSNGESAAEPGDASDGTEEGQETPAQAAEPAAHVPEPSRVEPVADPGDAFVPTGNYAFDVTLADGTVITISNPNDIDNLPQDADFGTPANLMKAQAALNRMTTGLDQEQREWEAQKASFEQQAQTQAAAEERVNMMIAEVNYLESKGKLPKVAAEFENADWSNPEVAKQPGVKERLDLFTYQQAENLERTKLGLPAMSLLEAHLQMQTEAAETASNDKRQLEASARKQRGAMVGGSSPSSVPNTPDGYIIGTPQNSRSYNLL